MKTLRELRHERGMTLAQVGEALGGIRPQAVHQWESGRRTPSVRRLRDLARLFGVPMEHIRLPKLNGKDDDGH